jgi:hypothetical protein
MRTTNFCFYKKFAWSTSCPFPDRLSAFARDQCNSIVTLITDLLVRNATQYGERSEQLAPIKDNLSEYR